MKVKYFAPALAALALLAIGACNQEKENKDNNLGEGLEKAAALKDNTYVVQKVGDQAETRTLDQQWSSWERMPMTDPETDATTMCVALSLEDGDDEGMTLGGAYFVVPEDALGDPQTISEDFVWKHPAFSANVFTQKNQNASGGYDESNWLNAKVGMYQGQTKGNMKFSRSYFQVKPRISKADPYTGLYQLIFYVEFTNTIYQFDETTLKEEEIEDGDYIIYGNALVEEYFPPVRSFTLSPHEFYLGYGGAGQVLEVTYQPANAKWDWADLEIDSSTDSFIYYPGTHTIAINTLAPHADAHVLGVQVKFWLKSDHSVYDFVYVDKNEQPRN